VLHKQSENNETGTHYFGPSENIEVLRNERDLFFRMLSDIDHLLDVSQDESLETLVQKIRRIMFCPNEQEVIISEDGTI
jgi:hypothetical protein